MQYSESSCIYLIELYTKEIHLYLFLNLDLANSFLTREFPDEGSACESRAFFFFSLAMFLNQCIYIRITQFLCFRKTGTCFFILLQLQLCNSY